MPGRFRRTLLLFLVLLLPLQGFAAARMAGCMAAPLVAERLAQASAGHCHETMPSQDDSKPISHPAHQCSHCAACALASALPIPAATRLPVLPTTQVLTPAGIAPFTGFIPDGPERPPRSRLA